MTAIGELATDLGWSRRRPIGRYRNCVGVAPSWRLASCVSNVSAPGSGWAPTWLSPRQETGAEIVMGLTDQDYGSHEFAARDPHGNIWGFGTYRPSLC